MAEFDKLQAGLESACNKTFGNQFRAIAKARQGSDPNGRPVADGTRPYFDFVGIFTQFGAKRRAEGRGISATNTHPIAAPFATISNSNAMNWQPGKGDIIGRVVDNAVTDRYEIRETKHHEGRTVFEVIEL